MPGENDISGKVGLDYSGFQKGVTALNQQIKNIEVSFRGSAAVMDDWSSTQEGLQLRISTLNDKLTLQKSKLQALTDEFNLLSNSEGDHTAEQQQLAGQMASLEKQIGSTQAEAKKYSSALDNMQSESVKADDQTEKMAKSVDEFSENTKTATEKTSIFGDVLKANLLSDAIKGGIKALGNGIKALASGVVSLAGGLINAGTSAAAYADDVNTLAIQTGLATDTIQGMMYAAELLDVDVEAQAKGMSKTVKAIGSAVEAGKDYITISDGLTVSLYDANGQLKSSEEVYYASIDALGSMTNATEQETAAQELFGKSYQDIMPLIKAGSAGLAELTAQAEANGYILSGSALEALNSYKDSLDTLANQKVAFTNALGALMAPALETFSVAATDATTALTQLVNGSIDSEEFSKKLSGIVSGVADKINENLPSILQVGGSILTAIGNGLVAALPVIATSAASILTQIGDSLVSALPSLAPVAVTILTQLAASIVSALPTIVTVAGSIIGQLVTSLIGMLPDIIAAGLQIIVQLALGIAAALPTLIPTIVDTMLTIVDTLINNIDLLIDAAIAIIMGLADGLITALPTLIDKMPIIIDKLVIAITDNLPKIIEMGIMLLIQLAIGIVKAIPQLLSKIPQIISSFTSGFINYYSRVEEVGKNIIQKIKEGILSLTPFEWGKDLISNFVQGIKSSIGKVTDAVNAVASKVKSVLGFSEPEEGPLSNFHTYMPDMMDGLSSGIYNNIWKIKSAANDAAAAISAGLNGSSSALGGYYNSTTSNTYNSYGAAQEVTVLQVGDEVVTSSIKNKVSRSIQNDGTSIRRALGYA